MNNMTFLKSLAKETSIYGVGSILGKIVNFLFLATYLTYRFPNTSDYSVHGIIYAFAALIFVFFTFRMETAFFRYGSKSGKMDIAFSTGGTVILISTILFSVILIGFAKPIAAKLTSAADTRYIIWFAVIAAFDALAALPFARLRLEKKAKKFAILKLFNVLISIIATLFFLEVVPLLTIQGFQILPSFLQLSFELDFAFIANIIASAIIFLYLLPYYIRTKFEFDRQLAKQMLGYAWPLIIVGVAAVINQTFDRILIKDYLGFEASGVYNGAVKLAIIMSLFAQAFNYAAEPFFFSHSEHRDAKTIYANVAQAFTLAGCMVFLGVLLYIDIIQILIQRNYREGLIIVPYALTAYLFLGLYYNFSIWYKIKDKTHVGALIATGGAIITIVLNVLLLPKIGLLASAFASMACFGFMCLAALWTGRKYYPIAYPLLKIAGYILLAWIIYLSNLGFREMTDSSWLRFIINTGLFLAFPYLIWSIDSQGIRKLLRF